MLTKSQAFCFAYRVLELRICNFFCDCFRFGRVRFFKSFVDKSRCSSHYYQTCNNQYCFKLLSLGKKIGTLPGSKQLMNDTWEKELSPYNCVKRVI